MNKLIPFFALTIMMSCTNISEPIQKERNIYENYEEVLYYKVPYKSEYVDSMGVSKHTKNHWYNLFINEKDSTYIREFYVRIDTSDGRMFHYIKLNLTAYKHKNIHSDIQWNLSYNETLSQIDKNFIITEYQGCCGGEDAYSLFSTIDGKLIAKYTTLDTISTSFNAFVAYQSRNAMNATFSDEPESINGIITFYNKNGIIKKYTVDCDATIPLFHWTPKTNIIVYNERDSLFKDYKYQNGNTYNNQELDSIYYKITIADTSYIYIGVCEQGLKSGIIISNNKSISEKFKLIEH